MADQFAAFAMPDTDLTRKTYDMVFELETAPLAHHSVRSYLFARAIGEGRGLLPGSGYDDEVLFLSCVLHDIGLTERGDGGQRFEVDGADVGAEFLRASGMTVEKTETVWQAIALHTSRGIANRMRAEIALSQAGIVMDVGGVGADRLPEGLADRVHAAYPRLRQGCGLSEAIVDQVVRNPEKAPMGSLPYELARQAGADIPIVEWTRLTARAWSGTA